MKSSGNLASIAPALLKAQSLMGSAVKGSKNPFYKSSYADLGAVLEACKDLLNGNGVTILQPHFTDERGTFVETLLLHESGEWVSSETPVICSKPNDPQALGSAISYARRYGLQSFLALPSADDDGELAMSRSKTEGEAKPSARANSWRVAKATPVVAGAAATVGAANVQSGFTPATDMDL